MTDLKRLVLDYRSGELVVRCLYRTESEAGPNTKARRREVTQLTRESLGAALEALEGCVDVVGTSGFTTREDVFLCTTKGGATPNEHKTRAEERDGRSTWRRRRTTAGSAAQQLDAELEQTREALAEEKRREHLHRAADLARERYALEARAEEETGALLATLSELEQLDRRHCQEMRLGGVEPPNEPLSWTLEPWLLTRLAGWVSENPRHQGFAAKTLPELDALAEPTGADA
jgi:hypothetical protein